MSGRVDALKAMFGGLGVNAIIDVMKETTYVLGMPESYVTLGILLQRERPDLASDVLQMLDEQETEHLAMAALGDLIVNIVNYYKKGGLL